MIKLKLNNSIMDLLNKNKIRVYSAVMAGIVISSLVSCSKKDSVNDSGQDATTTTITESLEPTSNELNITDELQVLKDRIEQNIDNMNVFYTEDFLIKNNRISGYKIEDPVYSIIEESRVVGYKIYFISSEDAETLGITNILENKIEYQKTK